MKQTVSNGSTTNGVTVQTSYGYNQVGGVTQITYPFTGTQITYAYSAAGRALSAVGGMNYVTQASYAPPGALASAKYGEAGSFAMVGAYTYNNRLQPNRMKIERTDATGCLDDPSAPGAGCILDFVYNFDADPGAGVANNGNVMGITNRRNTGRSQTFTYDELNRIKTAEVPSDWGLSFGYDIWGNLLNQTVTKGSAYPLSVAANTNNQIIGFCYDAAGNLTHQGACPGSSYTYDAENRLTATGGVTYTYDGDGKRVKKSNGTLYWHGAGGEVLAETDLSGVLKREYIYFNGSRVARHDPGGNWFYFADHLGSARVMTWQNGIPVEESDYYPFGGERVIQDTVGPPWDNNRKFTGQERDTESGLDYFIARHYASTLGRFPQPDPSMESVKLRFPQTWNRYAYVLNNPLRFFDPTGELWTAPADGGQGYQWVDECGEGQTCYESVAAVIDEELTIYGSNNAEDITTVAANEDGYVDLAQVHLHPNAAFYVKEGVAESFLTPENAADLFNIAQELRQTDPANGELVVTQAGNADGSPTEASLTHDSGRSVDIRYMGPSGDAISGANAAASADVGKMQVIVDAAYARGFTQNYSGIPTLNNANFDRTGGHNNHLHLGKLRPPRR